MNWCRWQKCSTFYRSGHEYEKNRRQIKAEQPRRVKVRNKKKINLEFTEAHHSPTLHFLEKNKTWLKIEMRKHFWNGMNWMNNMGFSATIQFQISKQIWLSVINDQR